MTAIFLSFNDSDTQILEVGIFPFNFILYTLFFLFTICEWWKTMLGATKKPITNHLELDNYDKLNCNRFSFFFIFNIFQTLYIDLVNWQFVKYSNLQQMSWVGKESSGKHWTACVQLSTSRFSLQKPLHPVPMQEKNK